jgi:hypothetical protein
MMSPFLVFAATLTVLSSIILSFFFNMDTHLSYAHWAQMVNFDEASPFHLSIKACTLSDDFFLEVLCVTFTTAWISKHQ